MVNQSTHLDVGRALGKRRTACPASAEHQRGVERIARTPRRPARAQPIQPHLTRLAGRWRWTGRAQHPGLVAFQSNHLDADARPLKRGAGHREGCGGVGGEGQGRKLGVRRGSDLRWRQRSGSGRRRGHRLGGCSEGALWLVSRWCWRRFGHSRCSGCTRRSRRAWGRGPGDLPNLGRRSRGLWDRAHLFIGQHLGISAIRLPAKLRWRRLGATVGRFVGGGRRAGSLQDASQDQCENGTHETR